jgi:murein DD-endopeptidase MepM/ murein hydrolase activator NlpD
VLRIEWPVPILAVRVQVGGQEVPSLASGSQARTVVLIGIDLEQPPGLVLVQVSALDPGSRTVTAEAAIHVLDAQYPLQRLTLPPAFMELDAPTLERVNREKELLDRLWETQTPERLWNGPFRIPLDAAGPPVGFGRRRIINGEPRAPHTGADFSARAGAPVFASNGGVVVIVEEHFFAGKSIVLDHGLGLYTMYFHLQESLVQPGQRVANGQLIARVGSTGRSTGPHLHWGARLHGARIDPTELLRLLALD